MKTFFRTLKKAVLSIVAIAPLAVAGCGTAGTGDLNDQAGASPTDGEVVAVAIAGGASAEAEEAGQAFAGEAQADMNAAVAQALSTKIEAAVNEELARMEAEEGDAGIEKEISVGLGERGLSVFVDNEVLPFAGGTMTLNGELGLKLRFSGLSKISLVASGGLTAQLDGVQRAGEVRGIPYELTLEGSNEMAMDGQFSMQIKRWKVAGMTADFSSKIVSSDVTATGTIAGRTATGSVDMVNVAVALTNGDVLHQPGAFAVSCTGTMATRINGNVFASCELDSSCRGCK